MNSTNLLFKSFDKERAHTPTRKLIKQEVFFSEILTFWKTSCRLTSEVHEEVFFGLRREVVGGGAGEGPRVLQGGSLAAAEMHVIGGPLLPQPNFARLQK